MSKLLLISALVMVLCVAAHAQSKPVLVLDVQQNADVIYVRPLLIFHNGRFMSCYDSTKGINARRQFVEKYFAPGKTYILIFGGGNAGWLKIKNSYWQDGAYAYGELSESEPGRIRGQIHALATDYDTTARGSAWRRVPTADERAAAIALAKNAYLEHNVSDRSLESLEVLNLTAIDVNGDDKAELVGSFKVSQDDKQKPPHFLFLIAELDGGIYKAARTNYQFNREQTEYPLGREMFAESLDIDGDGVNEIVTVFTGPSYKDFFLVYRRQKDKWNQVYSGAGLK